MAFKKKNASGNEMECDSCGKKLHVPERTAKAQLAKISRHGWNFGNKITKHDAGCRCRECLKAGK